MPGSVLRLGTPSPCLLAFVLLAPFSGIKPSGTSCYHRDKRPEKPLVIHSVSSPPQLADPSSIISPHRPLHFDFLNTYSYLLQEAFFDFLRLGLLAMLQHFTCGLSPKVSLLISQLVVSLS